MFISPDVRHACACAVVVLCLVPTLSAQSMQTLPSGFLTVAGGSGSAYPFNSASDHIWQWHYDSGQFQANGPIVITQVYVRGLNLALLPSFSFPSVEIVMASSPTDYSTAGNGTQPGHNPVFAANLNPDALTVRPAAPWVGGQTTPGWASMDLVLPFNYDPSQGNDFVIQIRKCGSTTLFGTSIDGSIGGPGVVFGNRYGSTSSCTATSQSATNNEYVPIVRIDYLEENNLAVTQSGPGVGDLTVILTMLSPTGVEGWTLTSGTTTMGPPGSGPFIGLWPDSLTWQLIAIPYAPGNPFHFRATDPGVFPQTPLVVPPGTMSGLAGVNLDFVVVMLNAASQYDSRSNLVRHLFQ